MELFFETREEWRDWLDRNHACTKEVWIAFYKKGSGKKSVNYNEAVEEAICFGWIDGQIRSISKQYYIQRYTPRRSGSRWSKYNIERAQKMIRAGLMRPAGQAAYRAVEKNPALAYQNRTDGMPQLPGDLKEALENDRAAMRNFMNFPPGARRMYIDWLQSAKKEETRIRRIEKIVGQSAINKRPGII